MNHGTSLYNLACALARGGRKEEAIGALGRAIDQGFSNRGLMESDKDLESVRGDAGFAGLLKRAGEAPAGR